MEIIVLILFLTVVMPRLKEMSMPKKFTDSGAKFYAPNLNANGAAGAPPRAGGRRHAGKAAGRGRGRGLCGAVRAVCLRGAEPAGRKRLFIYSLSSAVTVAADVAQYGLLSLAFGKLSQLGFRLLERVKNFRRYRDIINLQEACPLADIARASGRSVAVVEKRFERPGAPGLFPFGFVDDETGCFWANNAVWRLKNPSAPSSRTNRPVQSRAAKGQKACIGTAAKAPLPRKARTFCASWTHRLKRLTTKKLPKARAASAKRRRIFLNGCKATPGAQDDVRRFLRLLYAHHAAPFEGVQRGGAHTASSEAAANVRNEVRDVLAPVNDALPTCWTAFCRPPR